jgi:Tol biopolymer transport system component
VLFASDLAAPGGQLDLFAVHRSGQDVRRITFSDGSERTPRLSPDGRRLLFSADGEGSPQLYVAPFRATEGTPWSIPQRDGSTP